MVARCVKKQGLPGVSQGEQHTAHAEHVIAGDVCRVHLAIQVDDGPGEQRAVCAGRIEQRYAIEACQLVIQSETRAQGALLRREHVDGEAPVDRYGAERGGAPVQAHADQRRRQ